MARSERRDEAIAVALKEFHPDEVDILARLWLMGFREGRYNGKNDAKIEDL